MARPGGTERDAVRYDDGGRCANFPDIEGLFWDGTEAEHEAWRGRAGGQELESQSPKSIMHGVRAPGRSQSRNKIT